MDKNEDFGLPPKSDELDELAQVKKELAAIKAKKSA